MLIKVSTHSCLHLYYPPGTFEDALGQVEGKAYMRRCFIRKEGISHCNLLTHSPTTQGDLKAALEGVEAQVMLLTVINGKSTF